MLHVCWPIGLGKMLSEEWKRRMQSHDRSKMQRHTYTKVLYLVYKFSHKILVTKLQKCRIDEWMAR